MAAESSPNQKSAGRQLSPWAILSILSSSFVLCPLACAVGPLFGLKALSEMRTDPRITGRGMAKAGIVIGTLATALWIGAAVWWHVNVRRPILAGPDAALTAGFNGDLAGFRAGFCCEAEAASDEEAIVFLAALSRRYGEFQGIRQAESTELGDISPPAGGGLRKRVPYVLIFNSGEVPAVAEFVVVDESGLNPVLQFSRLQILDDNSGNISYPRKAPAVDGEAGSAGGDSQSGISSGPA